jgi:hypothetical protein
MPIEQRAQVALKGQWRVASRVLLLKRKLAASKRVPISPPDIDRLAGHQEYTRSAGAGKSNFLPIVQHDGHGRDH